MRLNSVLALSSVLFGVSAGPLAAKRQDASSSITTTSSIIDTKETSTSSTSRETVALVEETLIDGSTTTREVRLPKPTGINATFTEATVTEPTTTYTFSRTGIPEPLSTEFPVCGDDAKPFCRPFDKSTLYVGRTYYVAWNPKFFDDVNSTVQIKIQWANDSAVEAWSSDNIQNGWGNLAVKMDKELLQGYSMYNLTFRILNFKGSDPNAQAQAFDGPMFTLQNEPPRHLPPGSKNSINKEGLLIGLPVGLGFVLVVVIGLFIGMRKQRIIGVGNIMGRRKRGYGVGKSKRQRLGLGKKGAIRLEERELQPQPQYRDQMRGHGRNDSLGSLVSDDDIQPAPRTNQFRDEMQRQRTGR
ncbi:hypothetical protein N0V90_005830 [Kalmusia sp. IMI 367209]|nr:hypothetical protein N0V90_005830 [Kalmusia sp. IMI 367209]